jgi:DNA-binding response OmpR family regulator
MTRAALEILVVDRDPWAKDCVVPALRAYGHTVRIASGDEDAVRLYGERRPHVSLIELESPESVATLRKIRKQDARAGIIALTRWGKIDSVLAVRDLGVAEFFTKPPSVGSQWQTVLPFAIRPGARPLVIVDDEPTIGALLGRFLESRGYDVRSYCSGQEALSQIVRQPPDAMLVDLFMPSMNGAEVIGALRQQRYRGAVVALSAAHDEIVVKRLIEIGPVHLVGKPVDLNRLTVTLDLALAFHPPAAA